MDGKGKGKESGHLRNLSRAQGVFHLPCARTNFEIRKIFNTYTGLCDDVEVASMSSIKWRQRIQMLRRTVRSVAHSHDYSIILSTYRVQSTQT